MSYNLNLPNIPDGPVEMQVAKLRSYLHQTIGQLNFILNNLTEEEAAESATGLSTEEVSSLAKKAVKVHAEDKNNPHGVTAQQAGARPDTWTPTAEEVGARPDDWLPTPVDIAAAPATESNQYPGCYYRMVDGVTEWLNPPLVSGVEYATTRRWNGRTVYTKLVDLGTLPDTSTKTVTIATEIVQVISMFGSADSGKEYNTFPVVFSGSIAAYAYTFPSEGTGTRITVKTLSNLTAYTARFIIRYVKE